MLDYVTCLTFISVCVCAIMLAMVRGNVMLSRRERRLYATLYIALAVAALCDWAGTLLDGIPEARYAIMLLTAVEFSLAPSLAVSFGASVQPSDSESAHMAYALVGIQALMEFAFMPFGLVFSVSEAGVYSRGPLYWLYMLAYAMSAAFLVYEALKFSRENHYRQRFVPWALLGLTGVALAAQGLAADLRLIWVTLAVCSALSYVFFCNVVQQTDGLTSLLNRQSYESTVSRLRGRAAIVFFDVDDFKRVNDSLGHAAGDRCLREIAAAIATTFESHGACFRTGGDEFCAVLTRDFGDMAGLRTAFFAELDKKRKEDPDLPFVSLGYSIFDPESVEKDEAIARADMMMYRFKRDRKASGE